MVTPKVFAFVDHSNVNIMAQKAAGRQKQFPEGIDDSCVRIVPVRIFDMLKDRHRNEVLTKQPMKMSTYVING